MLLLGVIGGFAVFVAARSRQLVAGFIVLTHVLAIYGLFLAGSLRSPLEIEVPLAVQFIAEPQAQPRQQWQPPVVLTTVASIVAPIPDAPQVESPLTASSERAISLPAPIPLVAAAEHVENHNAPRLISSVEYLRQPVPRYPPQSRKLREQGLVVLRVLIDEHGVASRIEVESSSGHVRLDHAAREAVARAAFRPYVEDGLPRRALVLIPIEFSLSRGSV